MVINEQLTDTNFLLYAAHFYDNPECFSTEEFIEDLNRIKYIKRLFNKYKNEGDLRERLILNHIIILGNVFGPVAAPRILFFRLKKFKEYLKPFLEFLGFMPDKIVHLGLDDITILNSDIIADQGIVSKLKEI